jgi:hypothetical protein
MAWVIVDRVFRTKFGCASAKAVMVAANHCDEIGGNCYPGQEIIHAETELSLDTIQRQLEALTSGEFISRKKRPGVRGRWASWSYQINLSKLVDPAAPCGSDDQAAPCGVTRPHHAVSPSRTMRLKPTLKPFNEPSRAKAPSSPDGLGALGAPLRNRIGRDKFEAWFGGAVIAGSTEDSVTMELPTKFKASHVQKNFEADVLACCKAQQSTVEHVRFIARAA